MALPINRPISETIAPAYMADSSAASSAFTVAPCRGRIVRAYSTIYNAITGTNSVWTMKINGTAITGVSVTITQSGSAAGDVDSGEPTSLATSTVNEGDTIEFVSDGAASTTCPTMFVAVIERD